MEHGEASFFLHSFPIASPQILHTFSLYSRQEQRRMLRKVKYMEV